MNIDIPQFDIDGIIPTINNIPIISENLSIIFVETLHHIAFILIVFVVIKTVFDFFKGGGDDT